MPNLKPLASCRQIHPIFINMAINTTDNIAIKNNIFEWKFYSNQCTWFSIEIISDLTAS